MATRRRGHRHVNSTDTGNRIRVRGKRLDQVDESKLILAYWLLAKQLVADKTNPRLPSEGEVQQTAAQLGDDQPTTRSRKAPS
jgi:hypothetical protein